MKTTFTLNFCRVTIVVCTIFTKNTQIRGKIVRKIDLRHFAFSSQKKCVGVSESSSHETKSASKFLILKILREKVKFMKEFLCQKLLNLSLINVVIYLLVK